mmetsp:Transcript_8405/g.26305  ORF Transcript_8405/g.26305 Transcript_8405/m.26305 type:complete len:211 (+) Transcript_8405:355-987(+)
MRPLLACRSQPAASRRRRAHRAAMQTRTARGSRWTTCPTSRPAVAATRSRVRCRRLPPRSSSTRPSPPTAAAGPRHLRNRRSRPRRPRRPRRACSPSRRPPTLPPPPPLAGRTSPWIPCSCRRMSCPTARSCRASRPQGNRCWTRRPPSRRLRSPPPPQPTWPTHRCPSCPTKPTTAPCLCHHRPHPLGEVAARCQMPHQWTCRSARRRA